MKSIGFVFLMVFGTCFQATATDTGSKVRSLTNFNSFGQGLFRGARPEGEGFKDLRRLGVKTVIDLQGGDGEDSIFGSVAGIVEPGEDPEWIRFEQNKVESMGMRFINIPLNSLDSIDTQEGKALGQVLRLINDPKNQPVYIHCEHGADRTGLAVALYRVFYQNWDKERAHDEMIELGHDFFHQLMTSDMDDFFWAATADKN